MKDSPTAYRRAAKQFELAMAQAKGPMYESFKAQLCLFVFWRHIELFGRHKSPLAAGCAIMTHARRSIEKQRRSLQELSFTIDRKSKVNRSKQGPLVLVQPDVGTLFERLWPGLGDDYFYRDTRETLIQRLKVNRIDPHKLFAGAQILDAGCGSAKYSFSFATFKPKKVMGIDVSRIAIDRALQRRNRHIAKRSLDFRVSSIAKMPFKSNSFDFVWCNGVIHHTNHYEKCFREIYRVLKPNKQCLIFVNGSLGMMEIFQKTLLAVCRTIPASSMQRYCELTGADAGTIYWMVDMMYAPSEYRSSKQVMRMMRKIGFRSIKLLEQGNRNDLIERAFVTKDPYVRLKFGEGKLFLLAEK